MKKKEWKRIILYIYHITHPIMDIAFCCRVTGAPIAYEVVVSGMHHPPLILQVSILPPSHLNEYRGLVALGVVYCVIEICSSLYLTDNCMGL